MIEKEITIYFVRHGETYLNKYGRMQGWSDAPLTEKGVMAAKETGDILKQILFDTVYTSDLGRTIATARLIMECNQHREKTKIIPMEEFRESFFGYYEGADQKEAYQAYEEIAGAGPGQLFQGMTMKAFMGIVKEADPYHEAENYTELWERLDRGMKKVADDAAAGKSDILICTHGNVIRNIFTKLDSSVNPAEEIKNSSVSVLEYSNGNFKVKAFNQMGSPGVFI